MKKPYMLFIVAALYYAGAFWGLYTYEASLLVTALVLFGLPAYAFARFSVAPPSVLASVTVLGLGIAVLLEGVAHMYGVYVGDGIAPLRIFSVLPTEMLFATVLQIVFFALLYELVFDDGVYTQSSARQRFTAFGIFALVSVASIALDHYFLGEVFIAHAYIYLIGILVVTGVVALLIYRPLSVRIFNRLTMFSAIAALPSFLALVLAATNGHKIFNGVYIGTVEILNTAIPLEELLLVFALPFFVASMYELYLDDRV